MACIFSHILMLLKLDIVLFESGRLNPKENETQSINECPENP